MIDKMELTDFSKYQMDFLVFKNEVLKLLNEHEENQKKKEAADRSKYADISKKQEEEMTLFSQRITELSNTRFVEQARLDKIDAIAVKLEALTEDVSVNTIRLSTCQKELNNAIYKYDKIFLDNLTVPGLVGNYCKHKNLKEFIQFTQDNLTNLLLSKGREQASLQVYKDNIDVLFKQFSLKFDSILKQTFGYTQDAFTQCTTNYQAAIQEIYDKMDSVRLENAKYAITMKSQNEEFSKELEVIKGVKADLFNRMSHTLTTIESKNKDFNEKYEHITKSFETINAELKKHTIGIEGLNMAIKDSKGLGNPNRNKSTSNINYRERKGEKDKEKEDVNKQQEYYDDDRLKSKVIEIINEYYLSGLYGKELNGKKMDFKKTNLDVESNLKKYIKGEITTAEFSPSQRKRGSSFVNLIKKSHQGSPQLKEDFNQMNDPVPNFNLEGGRDQSKIDSNRSSIDDSLIKENTSNPISIQSKVKSKPQQPKAIIPDKIKSSSSPFTSINKKKLSIAIPPKEDTPSPQTPQNEGNAYSNILNWKINEKTKSKITKDKPTTERRQDFSRESKQDLFQDTSKRKDKMKDYTGRLANNNNNDQKTDMNTIREYECIKEKDEIKSTQKGLVKDNPRDINLKTALMKEQDLFIAPSNAFKNKTAKNKREISQESTTANFHYPHIESVSTPHNINTSKSESKYFFNKTYNNKKPKCQSAKRDEGNNDSSQKKQSLKLTNDQIEKKLIEMEYYTKKKFDELVSELQRYIPLNFKSHTRYCINDIEESPETQRRNKTPNEIEYENDLKHAKISIVTSEVIEKMSDNGAFRSLFPKKSPKYQGGDKKGISSFRKLQQGTKEKEKEKKAYNKTQLFSFGGSNGCGNINNNKEMNFSEAPNHIALSKLFTNMPKASSISDEKNGFLSLEGN